jgi:hypothetical protein
MVFSKGICRLAGAFGLLLIFSCTQEVASYNYDQDKLVDVLIDVHIARSALQNAPVATRDSLYVNLFHQICRIHQVDNDSISSDLARLTTDPEYLESIYEIVIDSLENNRVKEQAEY